MGVWVFVMGYPRVSSGLVFWNGDDMYVSQTAISIPLFGFESLVASLLGTSFGYRVGKSRSRQAGIFGTILCAI